MENLSYTAEAVVSGTSRADMEVVIGKRGDRCSNNSGCKEENSHHGEDLSV
jgi:hypothetical protein